MESSEPEGPTAAPRLERAMVKRPHRPACRGSIAIAGGVVAITGGVAAIATLLVVDRGEPAIHAPPPPVVVTIVQPSPAPAPPPLPPAPPVSPVRQPDPREAAPDRLGCPALGAATPSGTRLDIAVVRSLGEDGAVLRVVAAKSAARLAILDAAGVARASDDGSAAFRAVFAGHHVDELAIDRAGVLYARSGIELGIRDLAGRERWHAIAQAMCPREACVDRIATIDDRIAWLHDDQVVVSRDRGATFQPVTRDDAPWAPEGDGVLFAWRGALYQVQHYADMCGVDDWPTWRLDPGSGAIAHTIFHNHALVGAISLEPSDDAAATWAWRERCRADETDDTGVVGPCPTHDPSRSAMLAAKTLLPVEGGRVLSVYQGSLVELCPGGARQIYRAFPFDRLAAVDHAGRPLVVRGGLLLRWSAGDGWRRLYGVPPA